MFTVTQSILRKLFAPYSTLASRVSSNRNQVRRVSWGNASLWCVKKSEGSEMSAWLNKATDYLVFLIC